jgi:hypothetical protein
LRIEKKLFVKENLLCVPSRHPGHFLQTDTLSLCQLFLSLTVN